MQRHNICLMMLRLLKTSHVHAFLHSRPHQLDDYAIVTHSMLCEDCMLVLYTAAHACKARAFMNVINERFDPSPHQFKGKDLGVTTTSTARRQSHAVSNLLA